VDKRSSILFVTMVFVLLPCSALAHNPVLYVLLGGSFVVLAAALTLIAKLRLVPVFLSHKELPGLRAYIGVTALELFSMWLSLVYVESTSHSTRIVSEVDPSYPLYLILAFFPNLYLVKTGKARVTKAFILDLIFPVLLWVFCYLELQKSLYAILS
jgi:hypothetical protein